MNPLLSVIIPVYADWARLRRCLEALAAQSLAQDEIEVLVVNNEAAGEHPDLGPLAPNVTILHEPRPGSYTARNAALRVARGRYLAFTDSDCVPDPDWLKSGFAILQGNPGHRVTGPVITFREPGTSEAAYLFDFHTAFPQERTVLSGHCVTANLLVPREVLDRVGLFNDKLFSSGDFEWNERAEQAGVPILFDRQVAVFHPARPTVAAILKKKRRIAGSEAQDPRIRSARYLLTRLRPPLHTVFDRAPVTPRERVILLSLLWACRVSAAMEFALIRLGLRRPARS